MGSWAFVGVFIALMGLWALVNSYLLVTHAWDPYPGFPDVSEAGDCCRNRGRRALRPQNSRSKTSFRHSNLARLVPQQ
ncbi:MULTISPECIES: DUF1003 domain-containing protein [unclassified Arthrobacter]|uniref:DUF1003 domain-containing protein n=1 Tax=Arthrobacter sp. UYEF21 TaxID=1756364 RepID=UPI003397627A